MNTPTASSSLTVACSAGLRLVAIAFTLALAPVVRASLLADTFESGSLDTATWTLGSTGSLGTGQVRSGNLVLDVNQQTHGARTAVVTDAHNFNPFDSPVSVSLSGLSLDGDPGPSFNMLYSAIGRLPTDTGGAATGALAASYSAGGLYDIGGAFGVALLRFSSGNRIQILDSGARLSVKQVQAALNGTPTDMTYRIDGANATWTLSIVGATFSRPFIVNNLKATVVDATTITGTLINFTAAGLTVGEKTVSRFILGANNGNGVLDGAIATFGAVEFVSSEIPEPSSLPLIAPGRTDASAETGDRMQ